MKRRRMSMRSWREEKRAVKEYQAGEKKICEIGGEILNKMAERK